MLTIEHAEAAAEMAVDILFAEGDPFSGKVRRDSLVKEIRLATLTKLVIDDEDVLSEEEFNTCISAASIN